MSYHDDDPYGERYDVALAVCQERGMRMDPDTGAYPDLDDDEIERLEAQDIAATVQWDVSEAVDAIIDALFDPNSDMRERGLSRVQAIARRDEPWQAPAPIAPPDTDLLTRARARARERAAVA